MGVVTAVLMCICCPLVVMVIVVVVCLCCLTKRRGTGTNLSSSPPERGSQIPMDSADDPAPAYTYNPDIIAAGGCTSQPPPVTFLPSSYPAPSVGGPVLQHTSQQTAGSEEQPLVLPYPAASGAFDPPPPYSSVLASTTPHPAAQGPPPTTHYHYCASAS